MDPFSSQAPGFEDPVGVLRACHGRIERHCTTLLKLPGHLRTAGCDDEAREAARRIVRYFTSAALDHHRDEEEDLFPVLRTLDPALAAVIERLEGEHGEMEAAWRQLEPSLAAPANITDIDAFEAGAQLFCEIYRRHIGSEEDEVFAPAEKLLTDEQKRRIGTAMAARRGLPPPA